MARRKHQMSSTFEQMKRFEIHRIVPVFLAVLIAFAVGVTIAQDATGAKKSRSAASKAKKLPTITGVEPLRGAAINSVLTIRGKNFVKGKNKMIVVFQRIGSKRRFSARATATSTKKATLRVPNVAGDMIPERASSPMLPTDNVFRLRAITKFGAAKRVTGPSISPQIAWAKVLNDADTRGPDGDCDADKVINSVDTDDDNDLLPDSTELAIATDVCETDTDLDGLSDYWEYRVAFEYNGSQNLVLPYPGLRPYPNPLLPDQNVDHDGDHMTAIMEYRAWQFTGRMDRFYSDANQNSLDPVITDGSLDEDNDRLPNLAEIYSMVGGVPAKKLDYLRWDTDGDGLCDGLDDEDHDGPPTPLAMADCNSPVPNNGPGGSPPTLTGGGDPNGLIDADDNIYSNWYEWYNEGAPHLTGATTVFDPCLPSVYPVSPYCPGPFNPF